MLRFIPYLVNMDLSVAAFLLPTSQTSSIICYVTFLHITDRSAVLIMYHTSTPVLKVREKNQSLGCMQTHANTGLTLRKVYLKNLQEQKQTASCNCQTSSAAIIIDLMDFEQEETTSFQSHQMSSKDWSQSIKQFTLVFKRQEMQLQCNMALSCFQHLLKMNKLLIQTCKMYRHKDLNLNMYSRSFFLL